jgi:hypothetical protein
MVCKSWVALVQSPSSAVLWFIIFFWLLRLQKFSSKNITMIFEKRRKNVVLESHQRIILHTVYWPLIRLSSESFSNVLWQRHGGFSYLRLSKNSFKASRVAACCHVFPHVRHVLGGFVLQVETCARTARSRPPACGQTARQTSSPTSPWIRVSQPALMSADCVSSGLTSPLPDCQES